VDFDNLVNVSYREVHFKIKKLEIRIY
jgi:hypothetical protein